jgi:FdhE protein
LNPAPETRATQLPSPAIWNERQQRAIKLLARQPQAAALLEFLIELLELQRDLFRWTSEQAWPVPVFAPPGEFPRLRISAVPWDRVGSRFGRFLEEVAPRATETLADLAQGLELRGAEIQRRLMEAWLANQPLEEIALDLGTDPRALDFFPRAFVQPIAEWLAAQAGPPSEEWQEAFCPQCGRLPQLALLRDEQLIKGRHLLECSLCRTLWPFRRGTCPHCGESKPKRIQFHESEEYPHVRLVECQSCRAYLKIVDLRKNGLAIPFIEEIATVELDLWADEQGLWKLQPNVLGL